MSAADEYRVKVEKTHSNYDRSLDELTRQGCQPELDQPAMITGLNIMVYERYR